MPKAVTLLNASLNDPHFPDALELADASVCDAEQAFCEVYPDADPRIMHTAILVTLVQGCASRGNITKADTISCLTLLVDSIFGMSDNGDGESVVPLMAVG